MKIDEQAIPLSLYIHLPWCVHKCPYCDFNSHALRGTLPEQQYIQQVLRDLQRDLTWITPRPIHSIFLGGGTPSLFSPTAIADLLAGIQKHLTFSDHIEITMEANPGTVEQQRFMGFREAGIKRLSLGIQSLDDEKLKRLGRIHNAAEAKKAVVAAQEAGFTNINLDLMFGLPDQSLQQGLEDLEQLIALQPQHISWYQLTLEPNTLFHRQPPPLPEDETIWQLQQQGQALLAQHGYQQYEISAYAQLGKMAQHNLNYWRFGDYLGIGAGAHGKITQDNGITRLWKIKHPKQYLAADDSIDGKSELQVEELPFEFMLNALRLNEPLSLELFTQRTGLASSVLDKALLQAQEREFITLDNGYIKKTELGQRFLNDLLQLFLV